MSALYIIMNFNPRAPCGARLRLGTNDQTIIPFQSTRPMRGATAPLPILKKISTVSIHAPHAGRDI